MVKSYECPVIFMRNFKFFGMFLAILVVGLVSINIPESYAADFSYSVECEDGTSEIKIFDKNGTPMANASVMTMKKISSTNFEQQYKSDENGIVKIPSNENTGFIKISKSGYNDQKIMLEKCEQSLQSIQPIQVNQKPRIKIDSPVITDGYVNHPSKDIKITYSKIINSKDGSGYVLGYYDNTVIGIVKNISNQQADKIILKISENARGNLEHSTMPVISSLRPGESTYFIFPLDKTTTCYELSVNSYNLGKNPQTIIKNDLELTPTIISDDYFLSGSVINHDKLSKQIAVITVPYYKNEIIGYGIYSQDERTGQNESFDYGYWMLPQKYRDEKFNDVFFDIVAIYGVADRTDTLPGTKFDKWFPMSEIHRSENLIGEVFDSQDFSTGTCAEGSLNAIQKSAQVPDWVKNNAKWWSDGQVDDATFSQGIGFLIKNKVISISSLPPQASAVAEEKIPDWIKNNAKWWADGMISEDDFLKGITYMVEKGIIRAQ